MGMLRIDVPEGREPAAYVWGSLAKHLTPSALNFSGSVYAKSKLPLRLFEGIRIRVAQINGCEMCQSWRSHRDNPAMLAGYGMGEEESNLRDNDVPDEAFYAAVENWREAKELSDRERLAIEFTDRYTREPRSLDDDGLWDEIHASFSDDELVDMMLSIGSWIALGRIQAVLGVDDACQIGTKDFVGDTTAKVAG